GVRRRALRARSKWPHRRCDQPSSAQQTQLLDRRRAGRTARALAGDGARGARKLVVGLERLASFSRRHAGAGTHAPGQHRVSRDRDGARPLRHGARRLNQAHMRGGTKMGDVKFVDAMIKDGLWDAFHGYHMVITAENVAQKWQISRDDQDRFAVGSQNKAEAAQTSPEWMMPCSRSSKPTR